MHDYTSTTNSRTPKKIRKKYLHLKLHQTSHLQSPPRQTNEQPPNFLFPYRITSTQPKTPLPKAFIPKLKRPPQNMFDHMTKIKKPPELSRVNRAFWGPMPLSGN